MAADYLTVEEVAQLARCHKSTVRKAIHTGNLASFQLAGRMLVRRTDAITWIEAKPATSPAAQSRRRSTARPGRVPVKASEGW